MIATPSERTARRPFALSILALVFPLLVPGTAVCVPKGISISQAHATAEEVIRLVSAHYVIPEKRAAIVAGLSASKAARRYDTEDATELAARISSDLVAASQDKHLSVAWDPQGFELQRTADPNAPDSAWTVEEGRRRNQGIEELRVLNGNVRVMKVTNFMWWKGVTGRVVDDAMRFLRDGDAVLIDLRGNGGGSGAAVQYLVSHFLDRDRLLMRFDDKRTGTVTETRVLANLPAGRLAGKPLYVLIDKGVASAAEEFAYHVSQFKLGTLVGETTAGAANNNSLFPVAPGFVVSVSTGRALHGLSGTNWEGVGVHPDVECSSDSALNVAQLLALKKLASGAGAERALEYGWRIDSLEALVHPYRPAANDLLAFVGRYGIRSIRLEGGELVFQREGRAPYRLVPLARDLFAFSGDDDIRVRFRRTGAKVIGFEQVTRDGQGAQSDRTDSPP